MTRCWPGSLLGAAAGIPSNLVQSALGIAASALLAAALRRSRPCGGNSRASEPHMENLPPAGGKFFAQGA